LRSEIFQSHKGRGVNVLHRTICEVHRTLYDKSVIYLHDRPEALADMTALLEEAYLMGVRIIDKLIEHKLAMPDWEKNNVEEARTLRLERKRLLKEMDETGPYLRSERS